MIDKLGSGENTKHMYPQAIESLLFVALRAVLLAFTATNISSILNISPIAYSILSNTARTIMFRCSLHLKIV